MPKIIVRLFFLLVFASEASAWVRFAGSGSLKVGTTAGVLSSGNGDPRLFAMNALVVFVTLVITFPKLRTLFGIMLQDRALLLIYLYSFLSVVWADNVANSFRIALYLFFALLQFSYVGWFLEAEEQIVTVSDIVTFFAVISILGQYLLPASTDLAPGWTGIFPNKNLLGNIMAMGIISTLLQRGRWSIVHIGSLCICIPVLFLSQSYTAVVCVVVCGLVILYLRLTRSQKLLLVGVTASVSVLVVVLLPNFFALVLGASGKDTTLTGRDVIWAFAFKFIALRPFFGYGYYAFWLSQNAAALEYLGWNPNQAHNGFIDLTLNEGFVGLGILLMVFYVTVRRSLRQMREGDPTGAGKWSLIMLIYLLVHNVSEADFYQRPAWAVFVVSYIASARADLPVRYEPQDEELAEPDEGVLSEPLQQPALA